MSRVRFRFGSVDTLDVSFPSITRIKDQIQEKGIVGSTNNRRGARKVISGSDFVYIRFVKEIGEDVQVLNEYDNVIQTEQYVARIMRFLLLSNGNYAFESRQGVSDHDALEYIFSSFETEYEYERYDEFNLDQMRWFYKNRPKIRKIKVDNIGKREPNPHWPDDDIIEIVDDTGEEADNSIFSVGRKDNNLKNVDIIDRGFARLSDLNFIRAKDGEGNIQELLESGRFGFTYSSDLDDDEQSRRIRITAIGMLRNLFGESEDDE